MATSIKTVLLHSSPTTPPCFSVKKLLNYSQIAMYHHQTSKMMMMMMKMKKNKNKKIKAFSIEIRSSSICSRTRKNKIFEDQPKGIICFKDELTGEITCEGYDEGPRSPSQPPILNYHHHHHHHHHHPRDADQIIDLLLLHKTWHQLVINGMRDQTGFLNHHHGFTYWDNNDN